MLLKPVGVRPKTRIAREDDSVAVQGLNAVDEGRSVFFVQQVVAHLYYVVWTDTDEVAIERRVVQFA